MGGQRYPAELRTAVVEQALTTGQAASVVARERGISPNTLRRWIREHQEQERAGEREPGPQDAAPAQVTSSPAPVPAEAEPVVAEPEAAVAEPTVVEAGPVVAEPTPAVPDPTPAPVPWQPERAMAVRRRLAAMALREPGPTPLVREPVQVPVVAEPERAPVVLEAEPEPERVPDPIVPEPEPAPDPIVPDPIVPEPEPELNPGPGPAAVVQDQPAPGPTPADPAPASPPASPPAVRAPVRAVLPGWARAWMGAVVVAWVVSLVVAATVTASSSLWNAAFVAHALFLVVGLGAVVALDWHGLLWLVGRRDLGETLRLADAVTPLIWIGVGGLMVSGSLLGPDLSSPMTWAKLVLVLVVALNGVLTPATAAQLRALPPSVRPLRVPRRVFGRLVLATGVSQAGWLGAAAIGFANALT
ncbi:transposase IS3/IS911 family protein [Beutenbergia cavernae DSM 12333]|uniref:Transposase IS3/IS911 family protein n=1 Tax=Beutenbergia cavernae (strain ATCC BAA-8 / DSM 12333 / CCUG 43141 / JCM 11478 / NBRC 16432 / NCIMB 13614 / HKI 0122) TaxID=471853 RepID=C5C021_BEUC1|nr:transposase [Beutenbergia cavernae]ACQ79207.1 transposase IS3/IS911 family protein [Beutenbergia cavernae DSM 12333]